MPSCQAARVLVRTSCTAPFGPIRLPHANAVEAVASTTTTAMTGTSSRRRIGNPLGGVVFGGLDGPDARPVPGDSVAVAEVEVVAARGGAALALVLRAGGVAAVRMICGGGHEEERDLADLHAGIDRDGKGRDVRELEGQVAVPAGVNEAGGRVREQPEAPQRALPVEAGGEIIREPHPFERRGERELGRVEDERAPVGDLDELGEVL